jgi:hypothetical protein
MRVFALCGFALCRLVLLLLLASLAAPCQAGSLPPPLVETWNYAFVPDASFVWHGPRAAAGLLVWSHGKSSMGFDERGVPTPPYVKLFNDAGWDVVRFNRGPMGDDVSRASGWLHDGLRRLRAMGWHRIIAAGQSRGAWNSLQLLDAPGLADAIIAISPAAHGFGANQVPGAQIEDLRDMLGGIPKQSTRVAFVQFDGDLFIGSAEARRDAMLRLVAPKVGALLLLDCPPGFTGHGAGSEDDFATAYGACLLAFATADIPPATCEAPPGVAAHAKPKPPVALPSDVNTGG